MYHLTRRRKVTPSKVTVETENGESWKKTDDESSSLSLSNGKIMDVLTATTSTASLSTSSSTSTTTVNTVNRGTNVERSDKYVLNKSSTSSTLNMENDNRTVSEPRRSKSRVRSYLKKCKDAIIGNSGTSNNSSTPGSEGNDMQHNDTHSNSHTEGTLSNNKATSSWYVNEILSTNETETENAIENVVFEKSSHAFTANNEKDASLAIGNEEKTDEQRFFEHIRDSLVISENSVANLVDEYLQAIYPDYFKATRAILLRQARDLLMYTFQADLSRFEREFLIPAAKLIGIVKKSSYNLSKTICPSGWPLAIYGAVVLNLGVLDESLVNKDDLYLCIKPGDIINCYHIENNQHFNVYLCAVWRSHKQQKLIYHILDPDKFSLSPISLEMLTEELPQLLQNLLISVEQTINRVPLDELSFPRHDDNYRIQSDVYQQINKSQKTNDKFVTNPQNSPKCGLKRREIITKSNNSIHNRYALRRMSNHKIESDNNNNNNISSTTTNSSFMDNQRTVLNTEPSTMPLFCLGGSIPHIDSDEESGDDLTKSPDTEQGCLHHEVTAPKSIRELPEKLLTSGIYLSDIQDIHGFPVITIDADHLMRYALNCYEMATVFLYYNTIPISASSFTIHLIITDNGQLSTLNLVDNSLHLLNGHVVFNNILVSTLFTLDKLHLIQLPSSNVKVIHVNDLSQHIPTEYIPKLCNGPFIHNQTIWMEFFATLETLQKQCVICGRELVSVMNEIRTSDGQGLPSRRQLYTQHRALNRALMDSELQCLRRKGQMTITRLQTLAKNISENNDKEWELSRHYLSKSTICQHHTVQHSCSHVLNRLNEVMTIFVEVDRAARRLEQLTEQRRERLREITRQRALEEEIQEVITWIRNDGENQLKIFTEVPLDSESLVKEHENEFEKFYFISMKHLAKGRDLDEATMNVESIKETRISLKQSLHNFSDRLENIRERIEGAVRLHHLLTLELKEKDVQQEMQKLAEKIGVLSLIERCRESIAKNDNVKVLKTPTKETSNSCHCWRDNSFEIEKHLRESSSHGLTSGNARNSENTQQHQPDDDEEHSKMADSGLGGCDRCEGNDKLIRTCSCQSFDEPTTACSKSSRNSDDLEEDCFEGNSKELLDYQSPLKPNAHLYSYSSNLELPNLENACGLAAKTQKTLLLIIREMIGTERDYVRSLHYIIDNYMEELNREDIPQAMRGQRNVIFGNVEKICEFHQQYFLHELERCENNPLKVGGVFLEHESKFYLYALYNKNKPKSDALMSEYGTNFFKAKQIELDDKMDLASYLLKPVQRMGKYALLLQQLMKAVTSIQGPSLQEISEDIEELQKAEEMVRFQLRHGNDLLAMDSLRDCDVNVKEQGRLLRQNEFLVWQGRGGKKSLRQVFLFEDLVLFSKARRFPDSKNLDIYLYKNSIKTSDIGLTAFVGDSATKFEIWFRKRKPDDTWTLQSMNEDIKNAWSEEISKLLWKQAKRNRDIRMAEMSSMGIGNKPCLDIRPSQNQINDRSISFSQLEKAPKFRNSVSGSILETNKVCNRPNSIISLGSSFSSGTSRSSMSTSTASSSSGSNTRGTMCNMELELINETLPLTTSNTKKYQRSITLASQLSMESGIIADILTSPEIESHTPLDQTPNWPSNIYLKHSQSHNTNNNKTQIQLNKRLSLPNTQTQTKIDTTPTLTVTSEADTMQTSTNSNPYINNDSIAVHL